MNRRLASNIAVGLTSASLFVHGANVLISGDSTQAGETPTFYFTGAQRENLTSANSQLNAYWGRRLGSEATSELVIIEGNATFTCYGQGSSTSGDMLSPKYCPAEDTVVITAGWMRTALPVLTPNVDQLEIADVIMAHEHGHAVQYAERLRVPVSWDDKPAWEQQADCLAGEATQNIFPESVQAGHIFFSSLPDELSITHGPSDRRTAAYDYGVTEQGCLTTFSEYAY